MWNNLSSVNQVVRAQKHQQFMSVLLTLLSDLLSFQINETLGKPVHEEAQTYFALNMPHCISATTHYALIKENPLFDFYKDNIMRSLSTC